MEKDLHWRPTKNNKTEFRKRQKRQSTARNVSRPWISRKSHLDLFFVGLRRGGQQGAVHEFPEIQVANGAYIYILLHFLGNSRKCNDTDIPLCIQRSNYNKTVLFPLLPKGLGPNMVLVNAATGATISASAAPAHSLGGSITTQAASAASLPAGISVQQLLQQAQQQQAQQQAQQQVLLFISIPF